MNFFNKYFFPHFWVCNLLADSYEIDWPVKHTILKTVLVFTNICQLKPIFETPNIDGLCRMSPPTAHLVLWLVQRFSIIRVHTIVILGSKFLLFYLFHWHLTRIVSIQRLLLVYHALWGCRTCDNAIMEELALGLGSSTHSIVIIRFILRTRVYISLNTSLYKFWTSFAWTFGFTLPETGALSINWRLYVCNRIILNNSPGLWTSHTRRSKGWLSLTHSVVHINPLWFTLFTSKIVLILHALFTMWLSLTVSWASNWALHNIYSCSVNSLFYLYFFF